MELTQKLTSWVSSSKWSHIYVDFRKKCLESYCEGMLAIMKKLRERLIFGMLWSSYWCEGPRDLDPTSSSRAWSYGGRWLLPACSEKQSFRSFKSSFRMTHPAPACLWTTASPSQFSLHVFRLLSTSPNACNHSSAYFHHFVLSLLYA